MASHKSAEKRARQTERRTAVNTNRRSRMRGSVKKVEEAIASGDKKAARSRTSSAAPRRASWPRTPPPVACRVSTHASRR
jgi:small subunit ribosomal protein S20